MRNQEGLRRKNRPSDGLSVTVSVTSPGRPVTGEDFQRAPPAWRRARCAISRSLLLVVALASRELLWSLSLGRLAE